MGGCIPDLVLSINRAAKPDAGEDCYCYSFGQTAGMLAVFDGCGGLGAQRHAFYSGKTEAYMASRLCAGAFFDSFLQSPENMSEYLPAASEFSKWLLTSFKPPADASAPQIRGSMVRTLPSTVSAALIEQKKKGTFAVTALWAGDSRTYVLTKDGLAQLTVDDTTVPDPMENLYEDGILRNILCEGKAPKLHTKRIELKEPFCVFSATDGCFGYFSTPIEFEGVLLETLLASDSPVQWETLLGQRIASVAGDDDTLCLAAYGFSSSYAMVKKYFEKRWQWLRESYLEYLRTLPNDDRETRRRMWEHYRPQYLRYLKEE